MHSQSRFGTPSLPGSCLCLSGSPSSPVFLENKKIKNNSVLAYPSRKNKRLCAKRWGRRSYRAFPGAVAATPPRRSAASTPRIPAFEAIVQRFCPFRGPRPPFRRLNGFHSRFCRGGFLLCKLGPALVSLTQKQTRAEKAAFGFIVSHKALVFRSHMWV